MSGPELQTRLTELGSTLPIIFVSRHPDIRTTVRAMKAGAEDFLTKPVASEELLGAISRAIAKHERLREERDRRATLLARLGTLTAREHQVFELVAQGKINKQIAHELGIAERTVKAHRQRIMEKTDVQSLAELFSMAERLGVLMRQARDVVRANIDRQLELLNDPRLEPERRADVVKLLIAEEDKVSHYQEQLEFAESRAAKGRLHLSELRRKRDNMQAADRALAEQLVANAEAIQHLLDGFCNHLRNRGNTGL